MAQDFGEQGIAAKLEEFIVDSDLIEVEHLGEGGRRQSLEFVIRRHIGLGQWQADTHDQACGRTRDRHVKSPNRPSDSRPTQTANGHLPAR